MSKCHFIIDGEPKESLGNEIFKTRLWSSFIQAICHASIPGTENLEDILLANGKNKIPSIDK